MAKTNQGRGRSSRGRGSVSRGGGGQRGRGSQRGGCKFFRGKLKQGHPSHQQQKKHQQDNEKQPQRAQPQRDNKKPPPFPNFRGPTDRFVEGPDPQFAEIVSKCYGGFCVEGPETFDTKVHEEAREAFDGLENGGVFRTDVTQPFGLGTKCAATYVTRTLVGEPGTTYKYLGLRMFSHPWTDQAKEAGEGHGTETCVPSALRQVRLLNNHLVERSRLLLQQAKGGIGAGGRGEGEGEGEHGSCDFNIALINRMEPVEDRPDLKLEPTFGQDRCSVSWHADSCLEHYSTIAVYHATDPETSPADWKIALRVEPDAEGPAAGRLKLAGRKEVNNDRAPAIAVALPSRSAYFLLDEFNHHHQHAVLAGRSHRWSSTHRVAKKEGHSFDYISGRCQTVLKEGHRRTLKQWKAEQLTLSELEFEWIRQFYAQGCTHHDLHQWWHGPMRKLLAYWVLLERRTEVVVRTLEGAAESAGPSGAEEEGERSKSGNVGVDSEETAVDSPDPKAARRDEKARKKRAKQRQAVESLGGRAAFEAIAEVLRDRSEKRRMWEEREFDAVYDRLPDGARPMPCPLFSESADTVSPLPSTPDALGSLACAVLEWGKTFSGEDGIRGGGIASLAAAAAVTAATAAEGVGKQETTAEAEAGGKSVVGHADDKAASSSVAGVAESVADKASGQRGDPGCESIPNGGAKGADRGGHVGTDDSEKRTEKIPGDRATAENGSRNSDDRDIDSNAHHTEKGDAVVAPVTACGHDKIAVAVVETPWESGRFALEMQAPWARRLLDGDKTVETRSYPLPAGLVGRSIEVLESKPGEDGVSSLGDTVEALCAGLSVVGRVTFTNSEAYSSRDAWAADESRHLVSPTSEGYGWKGPKSVFAWTVGDVTSYPKPRAVRRMMRVLRSLFEVDQHRAGDSGGITAPRNNSGGGVNADVGADEGDGQQGRISKKKPKKKRKKRCGGGSSLADVVAGKGLPPVGDSAVKPTVEAGAPIVEAVAVGEETRAIASPPTKSEKKRPRDEKADVPAAQDQAVKNAVEHDNGGCGGRWRAGGRRRKKKKPRNERARREGDRDLTGMEDGRCDGESRTDRPVDNNGTTTTVHKRNKHGDGMGAAKKREGGDETLVSKPVKRKRF